MSPPGPFNPGRGNTRTGVLQLHGLKNSGAPKYEWALTVTNHLPCILALSSKSILAASSLETWPFLTNPPGTRFTVSQSQTLGDTKKSPGALGRIDGLKSFSCGEVGHSSSYVESAQDGPGLLPVLKPGNGSWATLSHKNYKSYLGQLRSSSP